jgi:NAD(P)-dependent dehydrogenase (short-subunit alcohol dehydrogenase family)
MSGLVVITGASAGIGLASAERFLREGYDVVNLSRRACPLPKVTSLTVDLADAPSVAAVSAWVDTNLTARKRIILVHNAAVSWHDSVHDVIPDKFREMLEVSLVAPQALNGMFLPKMAQGSAIIYIGSTLSTKAVPSNFSYVVAKHGGVGMMRATCQDLYDSGIHTVCVCPGVTDTTMLRSLYPPETLRELAEISSARRLIEPAEIAEVVYLAANNPVLNGAVIHSNYGQRER